MAAKVIVLVCDRDDPKHGEISVLEDTHKAERLVETLLEAGFEQERIRVFSGAELEMHVTHRPVVSLLGEGIERPETYKESPDGHREEEPEAEAGEEEGEHSTVRAYTQGGVRFSSLFRSA